MEMCLHLQRLGRIARAGGDQVAGVRASRGALRACWESAARALTLSWKVVTALGLK